MLSHTGACGRAGKRAEIGGDEKDIPSARSSSSAAWSGGLSRRSKLCNGSAAPAALQPFPVSKARRRYTNLTVWLPPHVTFAAEQCLPPSAAACISAAATASAAYSAAVSPPAPRTAAPPPVVAPPILPTAEAAAAPSSRRRPFALRRPVPPRPSAPLRPAVAVLSVQCCVVLKVVVVLARIGRSGSLRRFRRCAERLVLS